MIRIRRRYTRKTTFPLFPTFDTVAPTTIDFADLSHKSQIVASDNSSDFLGLISFHHSRLSFAYFDIKYHLWCALIVAMFQPPLTSYCDYLNMCSHCFLSNFPLSLSDSSALWLFVVPKTFKHMIFYLLILPFYFPFISIHFRYKNPL